MWCDTHFYLITAGSINKGPFVKPIFVLQAKSDRLVGHLVEDHSAIDPSYVEDFLLTYKTFLDKPRDICGQLLNWFTDIALRDKVKFSLDFTVGSNFCTNVA